MGKKFRKGERVCLRGLRSEKKKFNRVEAEITHVGTKGYSVRPANEQKEFNVTWTQVKPLAAPKPTKKKKPKKKKKKKTVTEPFQVPKVLCDEEISGSSVNLFRFSYEVEMILEQF